MAERQPRSWLMATAHPSRQVAQLPARCCAPVHTDVHFRQPQNTSHPVQSLQVRGTQHARCTCRAGTHVCWSRSVPGLLCALGAPHATVSADSVSVQAAETTAGELRLANEALQQQAAGLEESNAALSQLLQEPGQQRGCRRRNSPGQHAARLAALPGGQQTTMCLAAAPGGPLPRGEVGRCCVYHVM